MKLSVWKLVNLKVSGDERGSLIAVEGSRTVPFEIKRVYYIFNTKDGVARGFHAHKNLKQLIIAVSGSCRIEVDNGLNRQSIILDTPQQGLLIEGLIWREMHDFSSNCVLLVCASELYDEEDYIRSHTDFKEMASK